MVNLLRGTQAIKKGGANFAPLKGTAWTVTYGRSG